MDSTHACPSPAQLAHYLSGTLSGLEAETLEQHLTECSPCLQRMQAAEAKDTFFHGLLGAHAPVATAASPGIDLEGLKRRLKTLHASAAVEVTPMSPLSTVAPAAADTTPLSLDFLAPPQQPDEIGRLGPYRLMQILGHGGMGIVFRAEDPALQRAVAVKTLQPALSVDADAHARFLREARAAAAIRHDHIITIHQVGEESGIPYLAMEFLEGESLDDRLRRDGKLPPVEAVRIGREVALGLEAAHRRGLIHRDIKPANLWLEAETGRVKILDFGLARTVSGSAEVSRQGAIIGTPAYMAPEQAQGLPVDHRCDLFSLGCLLYRMTTGVAPFRGSDAISTLLAVATHEPTPPRFVNPEVPAQLSDLIMRLLAKKPEERPDSARAVAERLEAIAHDCETKRPSQPLSNAPAPRRRRTVMLAVAAGFFLLLTAGYLGRQIILRLTDEKGNVRDIPVKLGEKLEIVVKPEAKSAKGNAQESLPPTQKMGNTALVASPARLPGVKSWTIETVGHRDLIRDIAYSPTGRWLASLGLDSTVHLWHADKGTLARVLHLDNTPRGERAIAWSPDGNALAIGFDDDLSTWDVKTGRRKWRIPFSHQKVRRRTLAWSPDARVIASAQQDDKIAMWEAATGGYLGILEGWSQSSQGRSFCFSPDGKFLAGCSIDPKYLRIWDVEREQESKLDIDSLKGPNYGCMWSPDGKNVVGWGEFYDRLDQVLVFDIASMNSIGRWDTKKLMANVGGEISTRSLTYLPDSTTLACVVSKGSYFRTALVDARTGSVLKLSSEDYNHVTNKPVLAASPDGKSLAVGHAPAYQDPDILLCDARTLEPRRTLLGYASTEGGYGSSLWWSADGRTLKQFWGRTWNLSTEHFSRSVAHARYPDYGESFTSPDGNHYLINAELHETKSHKLIRKLDHRTSGGWTAAWSGDSATLITGGRGTQEIKLWDVATGNLRKTLSGDAWSLAVSGDMKRLARGINGRFEVLDVDTSTKLGWYPYAGDVTSLAWSPDGSVLVVGGSDGLVELRSGDGEKVLHRARVHGWPVSALAWSPDGKTLACYSRGQTRFLDPATGQLGTVLVPLGTEKSLAISPEGHYLSIPANLTRELVYVVETDQGQETLTPQEFERRFGWKNDPSKVKLPHPEP